MLTIRQLRLWFQLGSSILFFKSREGDNQLIRGIIITLGVWLVMGASGEERAYNCHFQMDPVHTFQISQTEPDLDDRYVDIPASTCQWLENSNKLLITVCEVLDRDTKEREAVLVSLDLPSGKGSWTVFVGELEVGSLPILCKID